MNGALLGVLIFANATTLPDTAEFRVARAGTDLVANLTVGFTLSQDGGATWEWTCHELVAGNNPITPATHVSPDGTRMFATVPLLLGIDPMRSLYRTDDGGCSWTADESLANRTVIDLAFLPGTENVIAVGSQPGVATALAWRSTNGGLSFDPTPVLSRPDFIFNNVKAAPGNPLRVYVAGLRTSPAASTVFRSDDGGLTWSESSLPTSELPQPPIYILGVAADDADRLWVRNDAGTDRVLFSSNGAISFRREIEVDRDVVAFAVGSAGSPHYVGIRQTNGVFRALPGDATYTRIVPSPAPRCLELLGGVLHVCTNQADSGFAVGASTDGGATFAPLMAYERLTGPKVCPVGSPSQEVCDELWPGVAIRLGLATPTPTPSASPSPNPGDGGDGGGCSCDVGTTHTGIAAPLGILAVLGCGVGLGLRRRRSELSLARSIRTRTRDMNCAMTSLPGNWLACLWAGTVFFAGCQPERPSAEWIPPEGMVTSEGGFLIDRTEVTRAQYATFLTAVPEEAMAPPCDWKASVESFVPANWDPAASGDLPVGGIDWCDARAYCRSVGKRLCGAIGGGNVDPLTAHADSTRNEWFHACTNGGERAWPYGDNYEAGRCHNVAADGHLEPAGSKAGCQGGVEGLFDMSGNAWEWVDSCWGDPPDETSSCELRGGGVTTNPDDAQYLSACNVSSAILFDSYVPRNTRMADFGIRCCAAP